MTVAYEAVNAEGSRQFLTDRIEWKADKQEVHAYPLPAKDGMEDGGFEIEIVLDEAPDSNVFEFQIEGADELDFFYQPALTDEEIAEGAVRQENVVGSYAVYHKANANHRVGDTNYATGKAYHIYRPKAFAADGAETWAELAYADGALTVTVPHEWLEKAAYPVRVDPTFGYDTAGASSHATANGALYGAAHTAPADVGTVTMFSIRTANISAVGPWKGVVVASSTKTIVSNGVSAATPNCSGTPSWRDGTYATPPSVTAGSDYFIMGITTSGNCQIRYDTVAGTTALNDTSNNYTTPTNPTDGLYSGRRYSTYLTYTAATDVPNAGFVSFE